MKNNGSMYPPKNPAGSPYHYWNWPKEWAWPPKWSFLTSEQTKKMTKYFHELANIYVKSEPRETECSVTQFMEAASRGIDGRNQGFLRADSLLVILLVSDREDCSTKTPAMWDTTLSWTDQYRDGNARCYYPPKDLLYPVEHYVKRFSSVHPGGRVLVAIIGDEGKPQFVKSTPKPNGAVPVYAKPGCKGGIQPTIRLGQLVTKLNALGNPNVEARIIAPCPIYHGGDTSEIDKLADRILELLSL